LTNWPKSLSPLTRPPNICFAGILGGVFDCPTCRAPAHTEGTLSIVRHAPGCDTLAEVIRRRWPLRASRTLPDTPRPVPFAAKAAYGRWHQAVLKKQEADAKKRGADRVCPGRPPAAARTDTS
jgi:hypothetical protein